MQSLFPPTWVNPRRNEMEDIARSATTIDSCKWVQLVNNTIAEFNNDIKPHTEPITPDHECVSFYKGATYGLSQLHLLALYCPVERVQHFKRLLIDNDIDKGILKRLVASLPGSNVPNPIQFT